MVFIVLLAGVISGASSLAAPAIYSPGSSSYLERLAARELRRYVYLRTGKLLPVLDSGTRLPANAEGYLVANRRREIVSNLTVQADLTGTLNTLPAQGYVIRTVRKKRSWLVVVAGADDTGTLYGVYRLCEHLGVRFYLHGDVVPDERMPFAVPDIDDTGRPLFSLRGIQPFHDFPEGPDWWNLADYRAIVQQLPKLRMNFIGLHTYPEPIAEPTVWIGKAQDIGSGGKVNFGYPASYQNTVRGDWGYAPRETSDFLYGASQLFDRDEFGADVMHGICPKPRTEAETAQVFERTGLMLRDAFKEAHRLGVKTCVGFETPLTIPAVVRDRMKAEGMDPTGTEATRSIYEGIFRRAAQTYPLDYFWLWTPEGWTWEGTKEEQVRRTVEDLKLAQEAAATVGTPFQLATCGWVLGPPGDRSLFDTVLPKTWPVRCINRQVGNEPVDPAFAKISGREKWAIPWLEDDPGLTTVQLWAGRMRRDASDALRYGCSGLMGIHWRTRALNPNISALAAAGWDQSGWQTFGETAVPTGAQSKAGGYKPVGDFYADWGRSEFGRECGAQIGKLFERLDGRIPRPVDWTDGPGGLRPDLRPWKVVSPEYAFVDELSSFRSRIKGAGALERFDYWLNSFSYVREMAELRCKWAELNSAMAAAAAAKDPHLQKSLAGGEALSRRRELCTILNEVYRRLLATVSTTGELGTVANWEQHIRPELLDKTGKSLEVLLGGPLPADAQPATAYSGPLKLVVLPPPSHLDTGEAVDVKALVLSSSPVKTVTLWWRVIGKGSYQKSVPAVHAGRGVYTFRLPAALAHGEDLEFHVTASTLDGKYAIWPATSPSLDQTIVVMR